MVTNHDLPLNPQAFDPFGLTQSPMFEPTA
jgi:hypothetical protein